MGAVRCRVFFSAKDIGALGQFVQLVNPEWPRTFEKYTLEKQCNKQPPKKERDYRDSWDFHQETATFQGENLFKSNYQKYHFAALQLYSMLDLPVECQASCEALISESNDSSGEVYNVLALLCENEEDALKQFRRALEISKQTVDWNSPDCKDAVKTKDYWGNPALRPMQRAQIGIATTLCKMRRFEESRIEFEKLETEFDAQEPRAWSSYINWRYLYPYVLIQCEKYREALNFMVKHGGCSLNQSTGLAWAWNISFCQLKLNQLKGIDVRYYDQAKFDMSSQRLQESSIGKNVLATSANKYLWEYVISHLDPSKAPKELPNQYMPKHLKTTSSEVQAAIYWNRHREIWLNNLSLLETMLRIRTRFLIQAFVTPNERGVAFKGAEHIQDPIDLNDEKKSLQFLDSILQLGCDLTQIPHANALINLVRIPNVDKTKLAQYLAKLVAHGFPMDAPNESGETCFHVSCYYAENRPPHSGAIISTLMKLGMDPWFINPKFSSLPSPAKMAANQGNWFAIQTILLNLKEKPTPQQLCSFFFHLLGSSCYFCLIGRDTPCQRCKMIPHDPNCSFEKAIEVLISFGFSSKLVTDKKLIAPFLKEIDFDYKTVQLHPLLKHLRNIEAMSMFQAYTKPVQTKLIEIESIRCCAVCGATAYPLKKCANCRKRYFCSRRCQVTDWPSHKPNCKK